MSVNTDQAIFDAIVAAISLSEKRSVTISVKKFIETFNGHRDRKLCTSIDSYEVTHLKAMLANEHQKTVPVEDRNRIAQTPICPDCGRSVDGPTHAAYCTPTDDIAQEAGDCEKIAQDCDAEMARLSGIIIDLLKYANHLTNCRYRGGHDCDCGLDEIRAARQPPVYGAMEAALEMGQPGVERMVAAVAQAPADPNNEMVNALHAIIIRCDEGDKKSDWLPIISDIAKRALQGAAQTPPDQFMDDYKRDTTNAMAARILELEAALRRIDAINDSPAIFNKDIDDVCRAARAPE